MCDSCEEFNNKTKYPNYNFCPICGKSYGNTTFISNRKRFVNSLNQATINSLNITHSGNDFTVRRH